MTFKEWRRANGLTQTDAANRFGVKTVTVSHWEVGKAKPSPTVVRRFIEEGFTTNDIYEMFYSKT